MAQGDVMRAKKHVVVLMGGISSEHDISLKSGNMVLQHIDSEKYKVSSITISRAGEWVFSDEPDEYLEISHAIPILREIHPDCIFIALHGPYGEDGRIQGMFDMLGMPYTGSGCRASAIAIDKIRSKQLVAHQGIQVADDFMFTLLDWNDDADAIVARTQESLGFPCVLKSPFQGSSLGMAIPQSEGDFREAVKELSGYGFTLMVERYLKGTELTCGVLDFEEGKRPVGLPVTEIRPKKAKFFDYQAKYTPNATDEITPAEIEDDIRNRIQEIAVRTHEIIGCRGFSRSDMILVGDDIFWLEINTIPGLTETSLLPQMAQAQGMSFAELVDGIIQAALI